MCFWNVGKNVHYMMWKPKEMSTILTATVMNIWKPVRFCDGLL